MSRQRLEELYREVDKMHDEGRWLDLVAVYEECIRVSIEVNGENHDETLSFYVEYGGLLRNLGRYEEALDPLQKALRISYNMKGPEHLDYASCLVNLANLLRQMNRNVESEHLFLRAKKIFEDKNAVQLLQYASLVNNLGLLYQQMGRDEEAIPLHQISLSILRQDPQYEVLYGVTLNNLVDPYKHTGQRDKAITCLRQAIFIFRKNIDSSPVLYATSLNNLGIIYYEDGDYEQALGCFKTAVEISKRKMGVKSESYQVSKTNYEQALAKVQQGSAATHSAALELTSIPIPGSLDGLNQISRQATNLNNTGRSADNRITDPMNDIYHVQYAAASTEYERPKAEIDINMKGLALSEAYFYDVCYPMLQKEFAAHLPRMAAGLVGEGSECFGFDDNISRDHDFGPSFQIFIPEEDMAVYGEALKAKIAELPDTYGPFEARNACELGEGRVGLLTIEGFYDKFLAIHEVPTTNRLWLQMNDISLSTATNGKVFFDNLGRFTEIREGLLKHYPDDVRLKRLAYECTQIAQSGQYNFPRSLQRQQYVAASLALNEFVQHFISFVYLINRTYKPYYKWEHEGLKKLPLFGQLAHRELNNLVLNSFEEKPKYAIFVVESLCKKAIMLLKKEKLTDCPSDFLLDHAPYLLAHAQDEAIRYSNPWLER